MKNQKNTLMAVCAVAMVMLLMVVMVSGSGAGGEQVRLEDVRVLTLTKGRMSTARRVSAIPQLTCVSGDACKYGNLQPEVMQCRNMGSDGSDIQWKCESDLDDKVRLGSIEVVCEGYKYPDDPFILKGSCGVEYGTHLSTPETP